MSRLSIPGIADVLRVDDAATIAALAADPRMDRVYVRRGPLLNRIILGRVRRLLQWNGAPLPPVAEHGAARPRADQAATATRLGALVAAGLEGPEIDALAAYVRGEGDKDDAGPLAQQAAGRLFDPAYRADKASWAAARVLGAAPSSFNPVRLLIWALTGAVARSRGLLAGKVSGDPTGIHATGVAIHNLAETFVRMRAVHADAEARERLSAAGAVGQCLTAPKQVLRQPTVAGTTGSVDFTPTTLVLLQLEKANARDPGYDTSFLSGTWSACPAQAWVPALLTAVWQRATEKQG
jgi:hypothetical protein